MTATAGPGNLVLAEVYEKGRRIGKKGLAVRA
jgi:hypothetical protein